MTATSSRAPGWLALVAQLPMEPPNARIAVLRTLETLGVATLREGVYLLPDTAQHDQSLRQLAAYVIEAGGSAEVLRVDSLDSAQTVRLQELFDRSPAYTSLLQTLDGIESNFDMADPTGISRVLAKQRSELERIRALDFYDSALGRHAEERLAALQQRAQDLMFPAQNPRASRQRYFRRTWATRRPLLADRLASAWLIRRFIDPEATLIWLDPGQLPLPDVIGYAYEGAEFHNTRKRLSYEELLRHSGRKGDSALTRIADLVRALDVGDRSVAEAAGVATLLDGARRRATSDDELLRECEKTFDLLYEAYLDPVSK